MNALNDEVIVSPSGSLDVLSQHEVAKLTDAGHGGGEVEGDARLV